jgi:hypothetical protein
VGVKIGAEYLAKNAAESAVKEAGSAYGAKLAELFPKAAEAVTEAAPMSAKKLMALAVGVPAALSGAAVLGGAGAAPSAQQQAAAVKFARDMSSLPQ